MKKKLSIIISLITLLAFGSISFLKAENEPVIVGPALIQKEHDQVLTISDILALYYSDLGGVTIESDGFTGNGAVLGVHELKLIASNGQQMAEKTVKIQVLKEIGYAVRCVTDSKDIHIKKINKLNPLDIVNVHAKTGLLTLNYTSQLQVITDNYSSKHDQPGSYLFEYRLTDASGLDKTVSCMIKVYEGEALDSPIIVIPKAPGLFDTIKKLINTLITIIVVGVIGFVGFKIYKIGRGKK